ncbi:MAG TPA: coproporphyrinogen III oxidase [Bacteroidales bacterium]|nr:MAG: coproporphyrinogen III oxidase [Bacteroidetes bacterium GWF2_33_38]OFY86755.1 MAG: coproporphyrinogen III oxidase [Bacteroidetes bacterium RIFOXYA2_FULL_33_7]HBF88320.1 coproporphyrinogen III oxidase [Bacteroidales bacterium]
MAGIYIHIPFCKSKCIYCDFYSEIDLQGIDNYVDAICSEIVQRKEYLQHESIESIYFGGGTPSLLSFFHIDKILETIRQTFLLGDICEITLEANPDDITKKYIERLIHTKVNRISLGIQSYNDKELIFLNRRHDSKKAIEAVELLQANGFKNISIDLIYGIPNSSLEKFKQSIDIAVKLDVQHISAYHLTYEKNTPIYRELKNKKINQIDEELSVSEFELLIAQLTSFGFIHYEISNFGKENFFSIHNSNYWKQKKYLGVGASAHSYDLNSRQWNISNIEKYIVGVFKNETYFEKEILTMNDKYNDYVLTSMRTIWGADLEYIREKFGEKYFHHFRKQSEKFIPSNLIQNSGSVMKLSTKGIFISDSIMSALLFV